MSQERLPPLANIPAQIACLRDYEPYARQRMRAQDWAYFSTGAADELTLQDNLASFGRWGLWPAALSEFDQPSTRLTLQGQSMDYPILLAPVAYQRLAHPEGELASVLGAGAMGATSVISMQASHSFEEIAAQAHAPLWAQWYWQTDRAFTLDLLAQLEAAGYAALMLTVDAAVNGVRNQEQRAGFALPEGVDAVNLRRVPKHQAVLGAAGTSPLFGSGLLETAPTWDDLAWLVQNSPLPVWVKGVMRPRDAQRALDMGVAGIVVSNHGGRTLDGAPASVDVLAQVCQVVQGRVPVLMDGGIRRGTDVLKALALGATAVMIGRPYIYGLAAAGAAGVAHVLHILRAELEVAMALTGCSTLADIGPELLYRS
ncbi:alpha-hydroxy-acid oxidizing protein [Alcaligenes faecalis subsp. faecalis]|uniref:alpha-hydroxy acid oxidase n=1 Tax=Alcaligenes faecalis TaxID=511 RepID=UPI001F2D2E44|nr:alpha-hydroxy acid oxidase [Alcaligenes faecalis]MBW4788744.1 alpha-hydroxy-acid oxidizing protein [Alcaligenes faecalis subsp. faecalis]